MIVALFGEMQANNGDSDLPNILWITTEDHGPHLGTYGDSYAHTPNIDSFAEKSLRYDIAWSDAPVCAPARTSIITGVYPTSLGAQHMRSEVAYPEFIKKYPVFLREAGYYITNNSKEDYNLTTREDSDLWDESSPQAHYQNRDEEQPFFAVFNLTESHESNIWARTDLPHHDPDMAPIPPYHPDTPEVRRDWAQYYHSVYEVDIRVGEMLDELEKNGLADDTIVFFYSDHGSGMPRHKRWPYNSGLHVPLIVHIPKKYQHLAPKEYQPGSSTDRHVTFVDLAPTLLSLIGVEPPEWMHGRAFMGTYERESRDYLFGFRGRMGSRFDMVRSIRKGNYIYVRNYMPHMIYGQYEPWMWQMETLNIWEELYHLGELVPPQTYFWETKPIEELYELQKDPYEVHNLAGSKDHMEIKNELRSILRDHILETRDAGFLPEAEMHRRANITGQTIFEMARNSDHYPLRRIYDFAGLAADRDLGILPQLLEGLNDKDPAIRYWAVTGIMIRGEDAYDQTSEKLKMVLMDENSSVQIAAAEILIEYGNAEDVEKAIDTLLELTPPKQNGAYISVTALSVLAYIDGHYLDKITKRLKNIEMEDPTAPDRHNNYVRSYINRILEKDI